MKTPLESRKAQITVFIILGIIIVLSVGIYSYMRTTGISPTQIFQPKAPPVVQFIDACIEKTATDALTIMGSQGGYISIPLDIALNPTRNLNLIPGVGGAVSPKVPFWYFDAQTQVPGIGFMELQTENYINDNLGFCLRNFSEMRDEYIITEKSGYSSDVVFTDSEVVVGLDYKVDIQPRGSEEVTEQDKFIVRLDVPIKRMHQLAVELLEAENRQTFFENLTVDMMASHPDDEIPFTGLSFDCVRKQWLVSEIKKKLIDVLEPAIDGVRFDSTDHPPFLAKEDDYIRIQKAVDDWRESEIRKPLQLPKDIPSDAYDYFQFFFHFTDNEDDYQDLKVVSKYDRGWGLRLMATPSQYGVMKSSTQSLASEVMQMLLCLNSFHFVYDVTYPVMISINAPEALHRTGFAFRFAFPVQIFHNRPDRSLLPTTIIEPTEFASDYCDFLGDETHTIIARDIITNAELSRVNLSFRCFTELCQLGRTRTDNRHLQWTGNFPEGCYGATIGANRSGYIYTEKQHDGSDPFYIDMYPSQQVKFDIKRHTETEPDVARFLEPDMYAIINVEHRDPPLSIYDIFGEEDRFNRSNTFELLRADATYDLNILLVRRVSEDEDMIIGGWMGNWSVRMEDMLDAKKIVFHVPQKYPSPQTEADMIKVFELMGNRSLMPQAVPEIIRADEYTGGQEGN